MADINQLVGRKDRTKLFDEIKKQNKQPIDLNRLVKRRSDAKADLDKWRSLLQNAYHYAIPNYNPFINYGRAGLDAPGQQQNADIYDLTLPIAHKRLADKMLMGLVPQGTQWVKFVPGDDFGTPDSASYAKALEATQMMTDQFFKILDRSNFYLAVAESLNDVLISTGVLAINEGTRRNPLKFEAVPASQVMFSGDPIDIVFRDWYDVRVETIKSIWPNAKLPSGKGLDEKVTIWECAYIDYDADDSERYEYVVMTSNKELLYTQDMPSWPWVIYRMKKLAGETRGRGPSLEAYPTAATINEALQDELIAAAFTANPMYMAASDSAFNEDTFEARPGRIIPVQMIMGQWPIQSFPGGGNINFSTLLVSDFRQQINELLYAFPLGSVTAPDKTATEAQIRFQENLESFAAMVPRLQSEFFAPVISRCMWIINKLLPETFAGIDEDLRKRMISLDGQILDLRFETQLMTARGHIKVQNLINFYQSVASVLGQEAATAALRPDEVIQSVAENTNVDMHNVRSKEEIQAQTEAAGEAATQVMEQQGVQI